MDDDLAPFTRQFLDCKRDSRIGKIKGCIDSINVECAPRQRGGNIGLVLVVVGNQFNRPIADLAAEILDSKTRGNNASYAGSCRVH